MKYISCGLATLLLTLLFWLPAPPLHAQDAKRLVVVPASGPLAGKVVYSDSYALLIGINRYQHLPQNLWLEYAVRDVTDLRDVLVKSYGFPSDHVRVLTDDQATKGNIENALSDLADKSKIHADDRILVYFSGHGQTVATADGGDQGFLIPCDAQVDLGDLTNAGPFLRSCLQMNTVWTYLDSSPAKHDLVIADACYSGLMASSRGLETIKPDVLAQMASLRAMQVMTAGTKGQTSMEYPSLGHGAFTYKLLEQLRAHAASAGAIFTTSDLYTHVCSGVLDLTDGKQYPKLGAHNAAEGDFLFITTADQEVPPLPVLIVPVLVITPPVIVPVPSTVVTPAVKPALTPEQQQQANAQLIGLLTGTDGKYNAGKAKAITVAAVQQALDAGADVNGRGGNGGTMLRYMMQDGSIEVVRYLLDRGADVNAKGDNGSTALMNAVVSARADVLRLLLDKGADVNVRTTDDTNASALEWAVVVGTGDMVKALLDKGADVNFTCGAPFHWEETRSHKYSVFGDTSLEVIAYDIPLTPLIYAVCNGKNDSVQALLDKGVDVNARYPGGATALMLAAEEDRAETCKLLLAKGADINARSVEKSTALKRAHMFHHDAVAKVLKAAGGKE